LTRSPRTLINAATVISNLRFSLSAFGLSSSSGLDLNEAPWRVLHLPLRLIFWSDFLSVEEDILDHSPDFCPVVSRFNHLIGIVTHNRHYIRRLGVKHTAWNCPTTAGHFT
jgi:hypothetical protein